jgi:rhodanese-related sulfurtransferase
VKKYWILITGFLLSAFIAIGAAAAGAGVRIIVDGRELRADPPPSVIRGRVFTPLRALAESLGADVTWDGTNRTVQVETPAKKGERYLQGLQDPAGQPDIARDFVSAAALRDVLDDDLDGDLADYRDGHSGGDLLGNDPLVVDVRTGSDYAAAHIPGAVWIAPAQEMGRKENVARLRDLLNTHTARGGKEEVVVYCYTGHTAGLVAGVLGTQGFNVKNLKFGFDIGWTGNQTAPAAIKAPTEAGAPSGCG